MKPAPGQEHHEAGRCTYSDCLDGVPAIKVREVLLKDVEINTMGSQFPRNHKSNSTFHGH